MGAIVSFDGRMLCVSHVLGLLAALRCTGQAMGSTTRVVTLPAVNTFSGWIDSALPDDTHSVMSASPGPTNVPTRAHGANR